MNHRHHCHAENCRALVPPEFLMCLKHWRMVPGPLQREVWRTYKKGQEITKTPTAAYLTAARDAIKAVAAIEARQLVMAL